jgi:catechol 2,3-dioxygenase
VLGAGGRPLLTLRALGAPAPRPPRTTGLYHVAYLYPDRLSLGQALARTVAAHWPLQGAADHGVSEAVYLADPDGLGIEIYHDRPRDRWPTQGGGLAMVTEPLGVAELLDEALEEGAVPTAAPPATRVGHVHVQVAQLDAAEAFYHGALGFDVMQHMGRSAAFVSAGGYHHHVGMNTWGVAGAPPAPADAPGLDHFDVVLPPPAALAAVRASLASAEVAELPSDGGWLTHDPSGNGVRLVVSG